jgi:hypothetical protein
MSNRANILMFHVDNISVGDFGCYGGAYPFGAKTPDIGRFASESLRLTNYNVTAGLKKDNVSYGSPLHFNPYGKLCAPRRIPSVDI